MGCDEPCSLAIGLDTFAIVSTFGKLRKTSSMDAPSRKERSDRTTFKPISKIARFDLAKDVILPSKTMLQLDECLARLRFHKRIYVEWNFAVVDPMGMAAVLNFYGPPGTGKTLCAEAFAGRLGLPFISLGIAELESKFMGETAKNIQDAFETARQEGAVLFFDEADTLLGKRLSSVTQGVDNEVNAMRSTLLIELERFDGIAIFATNFAKNYDEAFRSRIGYHIEFVLPDLTARTSLWNRFLIADIPLAESRQEILTAAADASEGLSGREIRTCMRLALPKAWLAAERLGTQPLLSIDHIQTALEEIRAAHENVGRSGSDGRDIRTVQAKGLLGIQ